MEEKTLKAEIRVTFDPEDWREKATALRMLKADTYLLALWDLDQKLRNLAKYSEDEEVSEKAAWARELLHDELAEKDINLDELP